LLVPRAHVNDLEIEYESFGDPAATPLLLVMGLAYQMIEWDDDFCKLIAARGFRVTRFDNRDSGLSSKLDDLGSPDLMGLLRHTADPPYTLDDMAGDAVGVLDAMGVGAAHVVGASMGGMIAQLRCRRDTSCASRDDPRGASRSLAEQPTDYLRHRNAIRRRPRTKEGRAGR
jgi:pimeloyl-ACP methyl ester carboxylesterase